MYTIYRLNAEELGDEFVESLRLLYRGKEVEIMIVEVDENENRNEEDNQAEGFLRGSQIPTTSFISSSLEDDLTTNINTNSNGSSLNNKKFLQSLKD